MPKVAIGKRVPDIQLSSTGQKTIRLSDFKGQNVVLYFYPKDNTTGCSMEAKAFQEYRTKFQRLNTVILGISRDSLKSHDSFRKKYRLKFDLLSDDKQKACKLFGVIKMKSMYGRKYLGIERSTFLIDTRGILRKEWRKVAVTGHVGEVLDAVKDLS